MGYRRRQCAANDESPVRIRTPAWSVARMILVQNCFLVRARVCMSHSQSSTVLS